MSFPGWIDRIGRFDVVRQEGKRPNDQPYLELVDSTRRVIWHTTEGSSVDGAVATLRRNFSAPHFVVGEGRIVQMRPLWAQAATVRGDNSRAWQVEVVGFSKTHLYLPILGSLGGFTALLAFFRDRLEVPLARPAGWEDDGSDIEGIWATEGNSRRQSNRAPGFAGHVMHLEWPENTHWDQGAVNWSRLFEIVREEDDVTAVQDIIVGNRKGRAGDPLPNEATAAMKWGWNEGVRFRKLAARVKELEDAPSGGAHNHDERYATADHPHTGTVQIS